MNEKQEHRKCPDFQTSLERYAVFSPNADFPDNIPEQWTDMNQQPYCVVKLQPGQSEYDTVKDKFCETCLSYEIEKVILH